MASCKGVQKLFDWKFFIVLFWQCPNWWIALLAIITHHTCFTHFFLTYYYDYFTSFCISNTLKEYTYLHINYIWNVNTFFLFLTYRDKKVNFTHQLSNIPLNFICIIHGTTSEPKPSYNIIIIHRCSYATNKFSILLFFYQMSIKKKYSINLFMRNNFYSAINPYSNIFIQFNLTNAIYVLT